MTPFFNTSCKNPQLHIWCKIMWSNPLQVSTDNPDFLKFRVKMAKMSLMVNVNDPHFQCQLRVSHDACLVHIWWFQLQSVMCYRADMVKFTDRHPDGRTDGREDGRPKGQTQATTIPLRSERPRGHENCKTSSARLQWVQRLRHANGIIIMGNILPKEKQHTGITLADIMTASAYQTTNHFLWWRENRS